MSLVNFKKGLLAQLPSAKVEGTFYVTTDERAIYLDVDNSNRIRLGDFQEFANIKALEANTNPSETALYYVKDINCLAKWDGSKYVQINLDTGATSVEVTGEGNAVTAASYDAGSRKLTLTMGTTFAVPQDITDVVGTVPDKPEQGGKQTVVEYINAKTTGIASDEALKQMGEKVTALETKVGDQTVAEQAAAAAKAVQGETESTVKSVEDAFNGYKTTNDEAVKAAKKAGTDASTALEAYKSTNDVAVNANKDAIALLNNNAETTGSVDYKVAQAIKGLGSLAKKSEVSEAELEATLKTKINGKADTTTVEAIDGRVTAAEGKLTTLIGEDASKSVRTIANEELAAQLIAPGAAESLDTLQEIAAWIQVHPGDAAAMNQAITDLETLVGTLPEGATSDNVVAYVKEYADGAIAALKIGDYAKATELTAAISRIAALEADTHTHANKEELDKIVVGDKAKWDAAEQNAKKYADGLNTTMAGRMDAAEGKLTTLTGAEGVAGSVAEAKKVGTEAAAAAATASAHADELNTAMDKRVKAAEGSITTLTGEGAGSVKKAEADAKAYAKTYTDTALTWGSFTQV